MPGDNYGASAPDSAALSITGDFDFRQRMSFDTLAPSGSMRLAAKYNSTGSQQTWRLYMTNTGALTLDLSTTGADSSTATSSTTLSSAGLSAGTTYWIRFTREQSTGYVKFYYAADNASMPSSWTQTAGQDIANAKDNATLEASINKAYTEMELAINMLTESDIRTGAMVENKEAFMENYKQQLAAQAILNKLNQSQTNVNNQQIKNLQEGINLIKSQTNLNEQQIQNLLQTIVNMKTENINNTIKTNQGNVQLELKKREIDVIEKLGYMGIGSRTAVDLIDMFKNSRISQPYTGGGVGTGKPIIGFG